MYREYLITYFIETNENTVKSSKKALGFLKNHLKIGRSKDEKDSRTFASQSV